jgi:hypothetical protein
MKRPSRIALTLAATTGVLSGAAVTVASISSPAAGGTPPTASPVAALHKASPSAAESHALSRQSALLRQRMSRLDRDIAAARIGLRDTTRRLATGATTPVSAGPAASAPAPAPAWTPPANPRYVAAQPAATARAAPPTHTATGASGSAPSGGTTAQVDGGNDD